MRLPSGSRWASRRSAALPSSSGRNVCVSPASCLSAVIRVWASTARGTRSQNRRMTAMWSPPAVPARCAAAVATSTGSMEVPVSATVGASSAASRMRRRASARVIRKVSASTSPRLAPPNCPGTCPATSSLTIPWVAVGMRRSSVSTSRRIVSRS
ncbi:Uncharacterised protein [Mycobacteroides abscessus subsp. abscessus]|nr:Uncharacterised protein [Mycobacteroides abscessus subsp. abscessus]